MDELNEDDSEEKVEGSSKLKTGLGCAWISAYLVMAIFEMFAIYDWLIFRFELNVFLAGLSSLFIAFIPGLGSLMAYWGATAVWGWESLNAIIVFFWYYIPIAAYYSIGLFVVFAAIAVFLFGRVKSIFGRS